MKQIISCEIGKRIRTIRLSKGKTMINLAHDSDMEYIQLSRIERGQINTTIFQLYKIAQALEVDLQFLFENFETEINDKLNFENLLDSSSKNFSASYRNLPLFEGSANIPYKDIVELFEVKKRHKIIAITFSIVLISLGLYFWEDYGLIICSLSIPFLIYGFSLPSSFLGIKNNKGAIYWVNVNECRTLDLIDLIEDYRRNLD